MSEAFRIAVIDDSKLSRKVVTTAISSIEGIEMREYEDAITASEEILSGWTPNLIVSDHEMPQITGLDYCSLIRKNEVTKDIPFLLVSGSITVDLTFEAMQNGVTQCIKKNFKPQEFAKVIQRYRDQALGNYAYQIMIVDDAAITRKIFTKCIEEIEAKIHQAESTEDADEIIAENNIDLIFIDKNMPGKNGLEWCRDLKNNEKTKDISIIGLSAEDDIALEFIKSGADDFVRKPFSREEILVRANNQLQRVDLNRKLISSLEKSEALNAQKNKLLGIAAHDLRSPISLMMSYLDLASSSMDDKETMELVVDTCLKQGKYSLQLLDDVLNVSSIDSGSIDLEMKDLDLRELLANRAADMGELAKNKNIEIAFEFKTTGDKEPIVKGDVNRLSQVVDNLLSNATKFSNPDTKIEVTLSQTPNGWLTEVKDQGQGIPESELPNIFGEFTKTSIKSTAGESSTGLGLAIVKKLVEKQNGVIWAESELGQGATFSFTLPVIT